MVIFHGSPKIIKDRNIASGTFFTEDLDIAMDYGEYVYQWNVPKERDCCFTRDIIGEHWVARCAIPIELFEIDRCNKNIRC